LPVAEGRQARSIVMSSTIGNSRGQQQMIVTGGQPVLEKFDDTLAATGTN